MPIAGSTSFAAKIMALAAAISLAPGSAQAQFSGLGLPSIKSPTAGTTSDGCPKGKKKGLGSSILGGVVGQAAGDAAYRSGVSRWLPVSEVSDQLTNAIACRLDPEEQKQAAEATLAATRGDDTGSAEVGASASWTSATREDVSGSSTVVGRTDDDGAGLECITVTDVIIVKGEETTANKRMCRPPGSARYSLVA